MQLLISLCISLQFYLQFLAIPALFTSCSMGTWAGAYLSISLYTFLHVAYLAFTFYLPFRLARESIAGDSEIRRRQSEQAGRKCD